MAIKYGDLCEGCQTIRDTTPPGDPITACTNCSRNKDTTASLRLKLEKKESELFYWQDCYETLLQQHYVMMMTEEVMMVPTKEFDQLVQYYKGKITADALLHKAERLTAERYVILRDK